MTKPPCEPNLQAMLTNSLEVTMAEHAAGRDEEPAIAVTGLRKAYGEQQALAGVDLTVRRGEVLAVLGPNGAGKTTLVEILEGHRRADAGEVRVLGHDPGKRERDFRARIGIVLQETGVEQLLTVGEAIALYSAAYPNPRPAAEAAELVGLGDRMDVRAGALSGGQRRRLDLAIALAGNPELIFLDEPTTGFDPAARRQSWELIAGLRELGTTILLTTHYMEEAQYLADRVVVVSAGRVIADGPPETLGATEARAVVSFAAPDGDLPLPLDREIERAGGRIAFRTPTPTRDLAPLVAWAAARDTELEDLTVTRPTLEEVYLELTQETHA
jgi:ABC-2 type transport system ATP-binding protein